MAFSAIILIAVFGGGFIRKSGPNETTVLPTDQSEKTTEFSGAKANAPDAVRMSEQKDYKVSTNPVAPPAAAPRTGEPPGFLENLFTNAPIWAVLLAAVILVSGLKKVVFILFRKSNKGRNVEQDRQR
jgi:hypothetical protein